MLAESAAGELIASEIEIRSGRAETFAEAVALQRERRDRLFALVDGMGLGAGARPAPTPGPTTSTSGSSTRRTTTGSREELGWVAQRNNTWSLHVHMGVRGADRAIAVCDWLRELLPLLLAVSANSPFLDRRDSGLHTVRTEIFTRTFPRCGVPSPFVDWDDLRRVRRHAGADRDRGRVDPALVERAPAPHASARSRCGSATPRPAATSRSRSPALIAACIAQTALDYDEHGYDGAGPPLADREIEENLWRAIRHGMGGALIDFRAAAPRSRRGRRSSALLAWTEPARSRLGHRGRPSRAKRRPARARGARRRRLDRGHLPRRRGGDATHLHRRCQARVAKLPRR